MKTIIAMMQNGVVTPKAYTLYKSPFSLYKKRIIFIFPNNVPILKTISFLHEYIYIKN